MPHPLICNDFPALCIKRTNTSSALVHFMFLRDYMTCSGVEFWCKLTKNTWEDIKVRIAVNQTDIPTQRVANYFLEHAREEGIPLTAMKLQKLVYIAYGWHLALTGRRLFEEKIEAWKHGPVVPSLYHEFKHFRTLAAVTLRGEID